MKRTIIFIVLIWGVILSAFAQKGLAVNQAFTKYGHARGCKMVEMHDATLRGYRLKVYKSLSYKNISAEISTLLDTDRKQAKKIREIVDDGKVVSGYYMMPQAVEGVNRFILFNNGKKNQGAVIYIEGNLSSNDIIKICYSRE